MSHPAQADPAFEPRSLVGTTLDGRYELVAHLATGGMGAVLRGRHVHLRKEVAVKVLRPDLVASADIVERFRREAEIASALEHDNIVRVTDFGRSPEGYLFLVMELLTGESLFDRLRREGFLPPDEAVPILWQVCAGLEAAHALGVVHRDLKPENVFLARTSSGREVTKILDFGIAKIADPGSASATQSGIVVGTPEYLSPEQAMGAAVDARADVYAVGLIAWRALAGRHPFKADDARGLLMMQATRPVPPLTESRPDLGAYLGLVAAVAKACAKDPAQRHQCAAALKDELAASLGPAFMIPPGATPAPSVSLSALPLPNRRASDAAPEPDTTRSTTAPFASRSRTAAVGAPARVAGLVSRAGDASRAVLRAVSGHPIAVLAIVSSLAVVGSLIGLSAWQHGRAAAQARHLLEIDRAAEARVVIDAALEHRPHDCELLLLRGRALHRIPGRVGEGIDAYAAVRAMGALDDGAREDLIQDLGRERNLADKAAKLLRDDEEEALPGILRAAASASGALRLRALGLARDLGAEERIDRLQAYGELLLDGDCEVRRAAARRLGEIGDPAAVPTLRKAAGAKIETKGLFGMKHSSPACGAGEAAEAARRIEAARLPAAPR